MKRIYFLLGMASFAALFMAGIADAQYTPAVPVFNGDVETASSLLTLEGQNQFVRQGLVDGVPETADSQGWNKFQEYNRNGSPVYAWRPGSTSIMGAAQTDWENGVIGSTSAVYRRADDGMGGVDGSGTAGGTALLVRTYYNDDHDDMATSGSPAEFGGVRDFEAATQILTETFDPTAKYILSAKTGDMVNSQFYDWTAHRAGNAGVTIDGDDEAYNGYDLQIAVGGAHDHEVPSNALYEHYNWGGTLVASNPGMVATANTWVDASTTLLPNPSTQAANNALAGQNVQIRLAALEGADHSVTSAAVFDNVSLTRIRAGDANDDGDVDVFAFDGSGDAQILSSNIGTLFGMDWNDGDFNGDGDVDVFQFDGGGDAQLLSGNLNITADVGQDALARTAEAIYFSQTGELLLDIGSDIAVVGFDIDGLMHGAVDGSSIFGNPAQNSGNILAYFNASGLVVGEDSLGFILPTGLTQGDLNFSYTPVGNQSVIGTVQIIGAVVPEPSSIMMLGMVGMVGLLRRRRS